jgi:hypothetical protein
LIGADAVNFHATVKIRIISIHPLMIQPYGWV